MEGWLGKKLLLSNKNLEHGLWKLHLNKQQTLWTNDLYYTNIMHDIHRAHSKLTSERLKKKKNEDVVMVKSKSRPQALWDLCINKCPPTSVIRSNGIKKSGPKFSHNTVKGWNSYRKHTLEDVLIFLVIECCFFLNTATYLCVFVFFLHKCC